RRLSLFIRLLKSAPGQEYCQGIIRRSCRDSLEGRLSLHNYPLFSAVTHSPDRVRSVVANQQGTIRSHCHSYRTPPDVAIGQHKAREEILIVTASVAGLVERHANHLVPYAHRFVPGAVLGGENVPLVLSGELLAFIKSKLERGIMRLQEHIRHDDFIF